MTTPERPSLADTIARIDAALAEHAEPGGILPITDTVAAAANAAELARLWEQTFGPPRTPDPEPRRQPTVTEVNNARELLGLPPLLPRPTLWRDLIGSTHIDWQPFGRVTPYLKPALEAAKPNPPATEPGGGWLGRALYRLFGEHP